MSGGFSPVNLFAQVGLGIMTGGSSLALQAAISIGSQAIKSAITEVAQEMGIPQTFIDAATTAFDAASGNYGAAFSEGLSVGAMLGAGASATAIGQVQSQVDDLKSTAADAIQQGILTQAHENAESSSDDDGGKVSARAKASTASSGGSWLRALAEVMGKKLNEVADQFKQDASSVDWKDAEQSTDFQVETQELSMFFQSVSTAIKSVGEGEKAMASRQ